MTMMARVALVATPRGGGGEEVEEGDHGGVLARVRAAVRRLVDLRLVVAERGG